MTVRNIVESTIFSHCDVENNVDSTIFYCRIYRSKYVEQYFTYMPALFGIQCSTVIDAGDVAVLPAVTLYQVVDVEFVPGTRLPLYVGRHTEAGTTTSR